MSGSILPADRASDGSAEISPAGNSDQSKSERLTF
jgi:hypothetical protein